MKTGNNNVITRRGLIGAAAGFGFISAAPVYAAAPGFLRGAGKIRRLRLRSDRLGETTDMIYWIDGKYIKPAMKEINLIFRDWRENAVADIDRNTINIIAATHNRLDTSEPFVLLSGYRTQKTNNMLRSRSRGVAKKSYHMRAMAADLRIQSRSVSQVSRAAVSLSGGGVGRYGGSNFTHVDSGPVRTWRG
jgi:uncharacterized protein YcbK (DUF882 family)